MSLIDRINANPLPFAQLLGIEFISAEADSLAARMLIRPDLCTMGGIAHGGAIMSFADTLGAAPAGSTLIGHTSVVHRGRRTQIWQTRVATEEAKLVALVVQTQMNL